MNVNVNANANAAAAFIDQLELAEPLPELQALKLSGASPQDGKKSGYVDDGSVVSFVAGVSAQNQSDVLNSTLLAQLAASKKYDRFKDTENWYKFYLDVLSNIGWVAQAFKFEQFTASGATLKMDKAILKILAAIASKNQIAVVTATLKGLEELAGSDGRIVLLDTQSQNAGNGNFQISSVAESGGKIAMSLGTFYFNTKQQNTRFLWFSFNSSKIRLFQDAEDITLNDEVYGPNRKKIIDKLGDNAKKYIDEIEI